MRLLLWFVALAAACYGLGTPSSLKGQSQLSELNLRSDIDTTVITLGDPIRLSLWVDHGEGVQVNWPEDPDLGPFELLSVDLKNPVAAGDGFRAQATYVVTAFELGELELPSITVDVLTDEGMSAPLTSDAFGVQVASVGGGESEGLRDIRGPRALPKDWTRTVVRGFAGLLVVVIAGLLLRRWLAGRRREDKVPEVPHRPIHELATEALEALRESDLLQREERKEFHVRLSEIVRSYLEGQFEIPALETTTLEVVHALRMTYLEREAVADFGDLLAGADLVKFAKHRPADSESLALLETALRLVDETWTPPEAPVEEFSSEAGDAP